MRTTLLPFLRQLTLLIFTGLAFAAVASQAAPAIPHLAKQGTATQLIVADKPFLVLGGELHNSSSSDLTFMAPAWDRLAKLQLNTVLAAVSWELIEPREGEFDFHLVDGLIADARRRDLRLILLWFGTWKNGMSSYAPAWMKRDFQRFPRVKVQSGQSVEIVSAFSNEALQADRRAFATLMRHLREVDGDRHTVVMVQVENEVGVLGDSRDRSAAANLAYAGPVPPALLAHLSLHHAELDKDLAALWQAHGAHTSGTWDEVFGSGPQTDELFMAWHYAAYIDSVTTAGKAEYPLPMFVNGWLNKPEQRPGDWPSGGPIPHTLDVWMAAASHLDLFVPDIYQLNFEHWCRSYARPGNQLFIPEMLKGETAARWSFYAVGEHEAIGVSPFGIDSVVDIESEPLCRAYAVLRQIAPEILAHQGKDAMTGFLLDEKQPAVTRRLGGYELEITLDQGFGQKPATAGGLIINTGENEFLGAGFGFRVRFRPLAPGPALAGILAVDEGRFIDGQWVPSRRLNGDEAGRGHWWRFLDFPGKPESIPFANDLGTGISRCRVYRYE
ncbi:MAG: DUF5597 domain-containing protein [Lacunisphaera sp.]|nr:DUF5597 domain-containing protein [Lacunisphaera sp.]